MLPVVDLAELTTPSALVDRDRLKRNATRMANKASALEVRLRPHVKTHKCAAAAKIQTAGGFLGITVSTLAEAQGFAEAGFDDIIYAVPLSLPLVFGHGHGGTRNQRRRLVVLGSWGPEVLRSKPQDHRTRCQRHRPRPQNLNLRRAHQKNTGGGNPAGVMVCTEF